MTLHPADPQATAPVPAVCEALRACGMTGAAIAPAQFAPGPEFAHLVVFLGCSPLVEPRAGETRSIAVGATRHAQLLRAPSMPAPRCPQCRAPVADWEARVGAPEREWPCAHCDHALRVCALDWRRRAACARVFVDVVGIHAEEAVPGDGLLDALAGVGAGPWRWIYR